jgi:glycerophosphoryl diester phosphodiesterase
MRLLTGIVLAMGLVGCASQPETGGVETMDEFVVIAHRGASGYLP